MTVTVKSPEALGVPVITPAELTDRPAGRPVAVQVRVATLEVSVALRLSGVMAVPAMPDWSAGAVTDDRVGDGPGRNRP